MLYCEGITKSIPGEPSSPSRVRNHPALYFLICHDIQPLLLWIFYAKKEANVERVKLFGDAERAWPKGTVILGLQALNLLGSGPCK